MAQIYNNYGQVAELTGRVTTQVGIIRDQIIPDVKLRWDETVATFTGEAADAFVDITREFHQRMDALQESLKGLNTTVIDIAAHGGTVQQNDGAMAKLFRH